LCSNWFPSGDRGLSFANSFSDNSHYVSLGQRNGYYVLRPGSRLSHQLGLDDAPYLDTADPFRHGYGADVLAFRFNQRGVLSMPPGLTSHRHQRTIFIPVELDRWFAALRRRRMWRRFLVADTVLRSDQTVSFTIMRCLFTTPSKISVADGVELDALVGWFMADI
jgi:hypothetical protein